MNAKQPNFEKFKSIVYDFCIKDNSIDIMLLGGDFSKSYHTKKKDFTKKLNTFLDNLDIRSVGTIIDNLKQKGCKFPIWLLNKRYTIEYNQHNFLDLIIFSRIFTT